jgi:uncharacterized tellurite resistance protein B-like protein
MNENYHLGLLCLAHLLVSADGNVDGVETDALGIIRKKEIITEAGFNTFLSFIRGKSEREIYDAGINLVNGCTEAEKLQVFTTLYKLSEVDGRVHVKEIRLLLYSIKHSGIEFDDVVNKAMTTPSLI